MSLPEQFVLLLHKDNGSYYLSSDYTGAAELGELVILRRVEFADKRKIAVRDPSSTGSPGLDAALALLVKRAGDRNKLVDAGKVIQSRRQAKHEARASLAERGLLSPERRTMLGVIPHEKFVPDTTARAQLVSDLRAVAHDERELDNRSALLAAIVHASGLVRNLGFDRAARKRLKEISKGEQLGSAVEAVVASGTAAITAAAGGAAAGAATGS